MCVWDVKNKRNSVFVGREIANGIAFRGEGESKRKSVCGERGERVETDCYIPLKAVAIRKALNYVM